MDAGLTTAAKVVNPLPIPIPIPSTTRRSTNPILVTSSWPLTRPNILYACCSFLNPRLAPLSNPRNKYNAALFLTHCSAKPNTDKDNLTDENPIIEPNQNSYFLNPTTPTSNQPLSSLKSSPSRGLVFDFGTNYAWDSVEIGSPVVKRYLGDEEERWYMWYHGRSSKNPTSDSVGLAVSSNGIHWERGQGPVRSSEDTGLVLNCSTDWWAFDTQGIRPCEVVIMSSSKNRANSAVYWLYYTGYSAEKVELGLKCPSNYFNLENPKRVHSNESDENGDIGNIFKSLPGLAMSQDGRNWARIEGEDHTGALLDVGSNGEWDSLFIASPQVVYHVSSDLRMYYHSFDAKKGHFAVGMARSRDGIRWVKLGKIIGGGANGTFDEFGALNARVVRNKKDGKYLMVYECVGLNGWRSIGLAVSDDGLKDWTKVKDEAVLKWCEENGWDDKGVGSPCLVQMEGEADEWRLYYRGIGKDGQIGIGLAVSDGSDFESFRRWTGFHL